MNVAPCLRAPRGTPRRWLVGRTLVCLPAVAAVAAAPVVSAREAAPRVVVTATRHLMLENLAPAALSVVTRQEIETRGADNLLDALRAEPGVSLQGRAIGGRKVLSPSAATASSSARATPPARPRCR